MKTDVSPVRSATTVHGYLRLHFERDESMQQTRLMRSEQQQPLKVIRAFPLADGAALLHLHNLSGGVLGGDQLTMHVEVGEHASVQLTTTSATRLYRPRANVPPAQQRSIMRVASGGLLEYLPDMVIPFAGARYQQETRIELGEQAGLFWWETLAPGRTARGEMFAYELFSNRTYITAAKIPIAIEHFKLEPCARDVSSLARFGPYHYLSTFYICHVGLEATRWSQLEQMCSAIARARSKSGEIIWGVSALVAHGLVVRALSQQSQAITEGLLEFWRVAKQELYGRAAIVPRKIY